MMINEAMKKYRLPNPTTTEDLRCGSPAWTARR